MIYANKYTCQTRNNTLYVTFIPPRTNRLGSNIIHTTYLTTIRYKERSIKI